jgi:Conjugal transfer protein
VEENMKLWLFVVVTAFFCVSIPSEAKPTRTVVLDDNEVAVIRTEIGYSTIIQFDSKPTSAVLGDQDAFKVEYVGNSLTVKPVMPSSRTNLFAFTDYDRFNFKLETTRGADVDYLVKVKRKRSVPVPDFSSGGPAEEAPHLAKKRLNLSSKAQGLTVSVSEVAYSKPDGVFVVSFALGLDSKSSAKPLVFEPGDIEVSQGKNSIAIENLYLESLALIPRKKVQGKLLIRESSITVGNSVTFRFSPSVFSKGKKPPQISFTPKISGK